jgi:hypothetical protein
MGAMFLRPVVGDRIGDAGDEEVQGEDVGADHPVEGMLGVDVDQPPSDTNG